MLETTRRPSLAGPARFQPEGRRASFPPADPPLRASDRIAAWLTSRPEGRTASASARIPKDRSDAVGTPEGAPPCWSVALESARSPTIALRGPRRGARATPLLDPAKGRPRLVRVPAATAPRLPKVARSRWLGFTRRRLSPTSRRKQEADAPLGVAPGWALHRTPVAISRRIPAPVAIRSHASVEASRDSDPPGSLV